MGRRPVTRPGTFEGGANGTQIAVLRNKLKSGSVWCALR